MRKIVIIRKDAQQVFAAFSGDVMTSSSEWVKLSNARAHIGINVKDGTPLHAGLDVPDQMIPAASIVRVYDAPQD